MTGTYLYGPHDTQCTLTLHVLRGIDVRTRTYLYGPHDPQPLLHCMSSEALMEGQAPTYMFLMTRRPLLHFMSSEE
jgi:hypothetical protein